MPKLDLGVGLNHVLAKYDDDILNGSEAYQAPMVTILDFRVLLTDLLT